MIKRKYFMSIQKYSSSDLEISYASYIYTHKSFFRPNPSFINNHMFNFLQDVIKESPGTEENISIQAFNRI